MRSFRVIAQILATPAHLQILSNGLTGIRCFYSYGFSRSRRNDRHEKGETKTAEDAFHSTAPIVHCGFWIAAKILSMVSIESWSGNAEVEEAIGFVGEELGSDLVEAAMG